MNTPLSLSGCGIGNSLSIALLVLGSTCFQLLRGEVLFQDSFSYPDGAITTAADSPWQHSSGGDNQIQVTGGALQLSEEDTEDLLLALPGNPFPAETEQTLFAAFNLTVHRLPKGQGNYWFHFRGTSSSSFRGRVFVLGDEDTGPNAYRLSITNGASAIDDGTRTDSPLILNQTYRIFVAYHLASATTQLWWQGAGTLSDPIMSTDSTTHRDLIGIAFRQSLSSGNGIGILSVDNLIVATTFEALGNSESPTTPDAPEEPEEPKEPAEPTEPEEPSETPQDEPQATPRRVTLTASETTVEEGSTLTIEAQLVIEPGSLDSEIPIQLETSGTAEPGLDFAIATPELRLSEAQPNQVWSIELIDNDELGLGKNLDLTIISPDPTVEIVPATFSIEILDNDRSGRLLRDTFDASNGPLSTHLGWSTHSGIPDSTEILDGAVHLTDQTTEDLNIAIPGAPFLTTESVTLYAGFDLTVLEALPEDHLAPFFAHFRGDSNRSFRGRLFLTSAENSAEHGVSLGVLNGSTGDPTLHPQSLALFEPNRVIFSYSVDTGQTTLWVAPKTSNAPGVTSEAFVTLTDIEAFAFRQPGSSAREGIGHLVVDNLTIATDFESVRSLPNLPPRVTIQATDAEATESATDPGTWFLTLDRALDFPLTVRAELAGSATLTDDFHILFEPGTLVFEPGQTQIQLRAFPIPDAIQEPTETISLSLIAAPGYLLGDTTEATIEILDTTPELVPLTPVRIWISFEAFGIEAAPRQRYTVQTSEDLIEWTDWEVIENDSDDPRQHSLPIGMQGDTIRFFRAVRRSED